VKKGTLYFLTAMLLTSVTAANTRTVWLLLANRTNYSINFLQGIGAGRAERHLFELAPGDAHCLVIEDVQVDHPSFDLRVSLEDALTQEAGRRGLLLEMPEEGISNVMGLVFCNEKSTASLQAGYIIQHHFFDATTCAALLAKHNFLDILPAPQDYGFDEEVIDNKADGRTNNQLMAIFLGMECCFAYDEATEASYLVAMPVLEPRRAPTPVVLPTDALAGMEHTASHKSFPLLPASVSRRNLDAEDFEELAHRDTDWFEVDYSGDIFTEDV
jgi:hypothetical protein